MRLCDSCNMEDSRTQPSQELTEDIVTIYAITEHVARVLRDQGHNHDAAYFDAMQLNLARYLEARCNSTVNS